MKRYLPMMFAVFGLWLIVVFTRQFLDFFQSGDRIKQAQSEVLRLEEENNRLKSEMEFRQTNFFVEKEARDKLGYGVKGESTVVFKAPQATIEAEIEEKGEDKPNWMKWLDFLF